MQTMQNLVTERIKFGKADSFVFGVVQLVTFHMYTIAGGCNIMFVYILVAESRKMTRYLID